jgi:hypothetical protein
MKEDTLYSCFFSPANTQEQFVPGWKTFEVGEVPCSLIIALCPKQKTLLKIEVRKKSAEQSVGDPA